MNKYFAVSNFVFCYFFNLRGIFLQVKVVKDKPGKCLFFLMTNTDVLYEMYIVAQSQEVDYLYSTTS